MSIEKINFFLNSSVKYKNKKLPLNQINESFLDNNDLIIIFESNIKENEINNFYDFILKNRIEEIRIFSNIKNKSKLFIRDFQNSYYLKGFLNNKIIKNVNDLLEFFIWYIDHHKFKNIYLFGSSMGGYGASLYGKLLSLSNILNIKILTISTKTNLCRYINHLEVLEQLKNKMKPGTKHIKCWWKEIKYEKNKFNNWLTKLLQINIWPYTDEIEYKYLDLLELYKIPSNNFYHENWCLSQNIIDMFHINRLKDYTNVKTIEAGNKHNIINNLIENNMLNEIIDNFLNN